jgi:hypothetical protein
MYSNQSGEIFSTLLGKDKKGKIFYATPKGTYFLHSKILKGDNKNREFGDALPNGSKVYIKSLLPIISILYSVDTVSEAVYSQKSSRISSLFLVGMHLTVRHFSCCTFGGELRYLYYFLAKSHNASLHPIDLYYLKTLNL